MSYSLGPHILLNCFGCSKDKLASADVISGALDNFSEKIGLERQTPPHVFEYPDPENWGVTGISLFQNSHITIHTFPGKNHAFIDIFSAKDFDINFAISFMTNLFEASEHKIECLSHS